MPTNSQASALKPSAPPPTPILELCSRAQRELPLEQPASAHRDLQARLSPEVVREVYATLSAARAAMDEIPHFGSYYARGARHRINVALRLLDGLEVKS